MTKLIYRGSKYIQKLTVTINTDRRDSRINTLVFCLFVWDIRGDDNIQSMQVGAVLRKIKSRTWKKQRYFKLQDDGMTIWYKSKKAGNTHSTCKNKLISKDSFFSKRFPNWGRDVHFFFFHLKFRWAMWRQYERAISPRFCLALQRSSQPNGASRWSSVVAEATWTWWQSQRRKRSPGSEAWGSWLRTWKTWASESDWTSIHLLI